MKKTNPALYAYIYSEKGEWENATPIWVLEIGKTVGNPSHGAAIRVGYYNSPEDAMATAVERGVDPQRVEVGK